MKQINIFLDKITDLIDRDNIDQALVVYLSLLKYIEDSNANIDAKGVAYVELANFMYQKTDYLSCLENLKRAQESAYSLVDIEKFIFDVFIDPNIEDFKQNYQNNSELFRATGILDKIIPFEELNYFFIPTFANDQYFVFSKKNKTIGKCITLQSIDLTVKAGERDVFSDHLVTGLDDFCQLAPVIKGINEVGKRVYILLEDVNFFYSFIQLKEFNLIADKNFRVFHSERDFKNYFIKTHYYLPRNIHDNLPSNPVGEKLIREIHEYRLSKDGRNGKNVLLTIGIPSWNRGNRALNAVLRSIESEYDEEIEILVSNNGTDNDTKDDYKAIEKNDDSRITYIELEKDIGFPLNLCNIIEKSKGRFVLMQSDEDHVLVNQLPSILKRLQKNKNQLAVLKTKTNGQSVVPSTELTKDVRRSCSVYAFTSNYLSGLIFNVKMALDGEVVSFIKSNYEKNIACLMYPHMVIELMLTQFGYVKGEDIILIHEGQPEGVQHDAILQGYANIDGKRGRIMQHNDWIKIIEKMSLDLQDFILMQILVLSICWKTIFLSALAYRFYYKEIGMNIKQGMNKAYRASKKSIKDIHKKYGKRLTPVQQWYTFLDNSYEEIYNKFEKMIKNLPKNNL